MTDVPAVSRKPRTPTPASIAASLAFDGIRHAYGAVESVRGVSFEDVWARRVQDRFGSTPAAFASLDDLIRMKEAAARQKDIEDLKYLRRLREKRR